MRTQRNGQKDLLNAVQARTFFDPASRIEWLKVVLSLAFFLGIALSAKLWLSNRSYPLTPISSWLPAIPSPFDYLLLGLLLVTLIAIAISTRPRKFIVVLTVLAGTLSLWDQSRLQPWCYQYLAMFVVLGAYSWERYEVEKQRICLNVCRFIVASIYIWSGVQKVNANFLVADFPFLMSPFLDLLPDASPTLLHCVGALVPVIEISMGVGLLTRKYKKPAIILVLTTHAIILLALILQGYNTVVWPWNVAMSAFVMILFGRTEGPVLKEMMAARSSLVFKVIFVLFGIMPAFSFVNLWDSYLSFTLYSGNLSYATLDIADSVKERLPAVSQQFYIKGDNKVTLYLHKWSYAELNVPPYPEWRVYRQIAKQICAYAENPSGVVLTVYEKPAWLSGKREMKSCDCSGFTTATPNQSAFNEKSQPRLKSAP